MGNIKEIVDSLVKKYNTSSPYELCKLLNITVNRCELGTVRGYYYHAYRIKQIYINCNLSKNDEEIVLSHELGHAIMHPNANTPFLRENTLFSTDKMEIQANKFAIYLLVSDELLLEYQCYTVEQLSTVLGYDKKLIELRLQ